MAAKGLAALAIGLGNGYMKAERQGLEDQRQARLDQMRQEEHDIRLDAYKRDNEMRQVLADAAKPASLADGYQVTDAAGSNAFTKDADAAAVMGDMAEAKNGGATTNSAIRLDRPVGGPEVFTDPGKAQVSLADYNKPEAQQQRQVQAVSTVDPVKGLTLQNSILNSQKSTMEMEEMQRKRRAEIESEGLVATARAAMNGDPISVAEAFNKQGNWKVDGELKVVPEKRKAPWGEDIDTFTYTGNIKDKDGNTRPVRVNSLDAMTQMVPFKDLFESRAKVGLENVKHTNNLGEIDARGKTELQQIGARGVQDRQTADHKSKSGGDPLGREERLRYTTLFQDAGRRLAESQKALGALQKDAFFMSQAQKPGTKQAEELAGLKQTIEQYASDRSMYQGLLAKGQGPAAPESKPETGPKRITTKAERDALPKGARYVAPDGQTYVKQ